jgi:hypothetical protein
LAASFTGFPLVLLGSWEALLLNLLLRVGPSDNPFVAVAQSGGLPRAFTGEQRFTKSIGLAFHRRPQGSDHP